MFRKYLAAALAALLAVGVCAPCARAQSGRRFPKAPAGRDFIKLTDEKSDAAGQAADGTPAVGANPRRVKKVDLRDLNAGRQAPVVYAEDDGKCHSTKCRVAVGAFATYLVFAMILWGISDNP